MLWIRALVAAAALCMAIPTEAEMLHDDLTVFGECIQQREQPRVEEIGREVYRDDVWVPAPPPPTLAPEFPGTVQEKGDEAPSPPVHGTGS
jgi:hypothetical protein